MINTERTAWEQVTKETLYRHFVTDKERHKTIGARYGVTPSAVERKLRAFGIFLSPEERYRRRSEDRHKTRAGDCLRKLTEECAPLLLLCTPQLYNAT